MTPASSTPQPTPFADSSIVELAWNQSAAGMCLVGADGKVSRVNHAFAELVGYAEKTLEGMPLVRLHPAEHEIAMQTVHREVIEADDSAVWLGKETYFTNSRGRPIVAHARNARILSPTGEVVRLITMVDLSDIARSNRRYELINRVESYTALSSTVSNDLNNLLSIILGYTALLRAGSVD